MSKKRAPKSRGRKRTTAGKIDVLKIFTMPLKVGKDGSKQSMSPFEVSLRAQVKKAIKDRNLSAIKNVLQLALEYEVAEVPPKIQNGGVKIGPLHLTAEQIKRYQDAKAKGSIKADEKIENIIAQQKVSKT